MKAECVSCEALIEVGAHPELGDIVICPKCDARLMVVWLDPVELDWAEDEEYLDEDFEDFGEGFEEDEVFEDEDWEEEDDDAF